jgi:uncharacterized membrane-anchored protein
MNKVATISLGFWVMKICATTLGETAGDLLSMTMNIGYGLSSVILITAFFASLLAQLSATKFHPGLYWLVILTTSTAGTTISDYIDRTLGLGYATGSSILVTGLIVVLTAWYITEKSLSVSNIVTVRAEFFYWTAILFSNTLGTALGDFLADNSGLGFMGGALLIASIIAALALASRFSVFNKLVLFWLAFVLTRPFGATFGDFMTKPLEKGGLDFGTVGSSAVLAGLLIAMLLYSGIKARAKLASVAK